MVNLMIKYKYILFDLDGTISESASGIRESLEYAIAKLDKPVPDLSDYTLYIGPPLLDTFRNICHFSDEVSREGVEIYRGYYNEKGKFANKTYSGVAELLENIKAQDCKVAVCSSKYEAFAKEIIEILGLEKYFDAVCGSTLDGSRKDKKDLIPYAVESLGGNLEADRGSIVMIGDTYFDARGAVQTGVDFIGVTYGYGSVEQMKAHGAENLADEPLDILTFLK